MPAAEEHYITRMGWLRAAVLGANDGIVSTASLIVGVASASAGRSDVLLAGAAGLAAGALSMAAGEYVSVSSQADSEAGELKREARSLRENPGLELEELTRIYEERGLDPALALQVAHALTESDALSAHARDELGMTDTSAAQPLMAAGASAVSFAGGAALPLLIAAVVPLAQVSLWVAVASLISLALLGALAARAGGAGMLRAMVRVTFWGAVAMGVTALVGKAVGGVL